MCIERGMKMTEQRRVIARVLSDATDHPDVEELFRRSAAVDDNISIATVYRTVRLFEEAGLLIATTLAMGVPGMKNLQMTITTI